MDPQHPAPAQIITEQQLNYRVEALTLHRELHVGGRNDPDYWLIDTMILESKLNYVTGLMQLIPMADETHRELREALEAQVTATRQSIEHAYRMWHIRTQFAELWEEVRLNHIQNAMIGWEAMRVHMDEFTDRIAAQGVAELEDEMNVLLMEIDVQELHILEMELQRLHI